MEYEGLIEPKVLQKLQDYFCRSTGVYLACVGRHLGVLTKAYGSRPEREFIHSMVDKDTYMSLLKKLQNSSVESVIEEPIDFDFIKMVGITTRIEENSQISWVAIGVISDNIPEGFELPEGVMSTTEEKFYHSIELLEVVTVNFIQAKLNEAKVKNHMLEINEAEEKAEDEIKRNSVMTELVRLLGSDEGFSSIVQEALKLVCDALEIAGGSLIRESRNSQCYEVLCEYRNNDSSSDIPVQSEIPKDEIPFFTGKPYMISYDTIKPENFKQYLEKNKISAAIYQPIVVNGRNEMYLCFYEYEKDRIWSVSDIAFANEVKGIIQSILSKRIEKNSLASSYTSLEAILENVGCSIFVSDSVNRKILYMNRRFQSVFGKALSEGKLDDVVFAHMEIDKENSFEECYLPDENMWIDIHRTSINWVDGKLVNLCTIYDITDKKLYQKEIENTAKNDYLTGLPNRMSFESNLERNIRMAEIDGKKGAVIYIDLDDFKNVNEGVGHKYGDVVLKSVAHNLQKIDGIEDSVYRVGGDEFCVIVTDTDSVKPEWVCGEIVKIFTKPWMLKGQEKQCTVSVGVSYYPDDGIKADEIVSKADRALFSAKKKGKNCVVFYDELEQNAGGEKADYESTMRHAVRESIDQFKVYYQPVVDNKKKDCPCVGAEALVRWESKEFGLQLPEKLMPAAEYLGLLNEIDEQVIIQAVKRCKYWNDMGHPEYKVHINLSDSGILSGGIAGKIKDALEESRVAPKNVCFEVTESLWKDNKDAMIKTLQSIKKLGVRIILDNFGAEYSSINCLKELPIDGIKFDKKIVKDMETDEYIKAMVIAVSGLCKTLGIKVYAVGVENSGEHELTKEQEMDLVQGYYFGKPVSEEEFEDKYL